MGLEFKKRAPLKVVTSEQPDHSLNNEEGFIMIYTDPTDCSGFQYEEL
jgi:hypothetical protein